MKLFKTVVAAALAASALAATPGDAQDWRHHGRDRGHWDRGGGRGWHGDRGYRGGGYGYRGGGYGWHHSYGWRRHRVCGWGWHHHWRCFWR